MEPVDSASAALVIVLFHPSADDIAHVSMLASHVGGAVVDNSDAPCVQTDTIGRMAYICNGKNLGIATAQNIGIRTLLARHPGLRHIVFLDQDSRLGPDYVAQITAAFDAISHELPRLALLGPTAFRQDDGSEYKSVIHHDKSVIHHDKSAATSLPFIPRREVISSGSCISTAALADVGLNDEPLFIDYVDFEWCWRASSKGYVCGITPAVRIAHKVGQRELSFPGGYRVIISAPFRYFYQYRNYLWLCRRSYVPRQWKINKGVKLFLRLLYFPLLVRGGYARWRQMLRGIKAAFRS